MLRRIYRGIIIYLRRSSCKLPVFLVIFESEFEVSRYSFSLSSNIKFHENPSNGSRVLPCGRTDRRTWRT